MSAAIKLNDLEKVRKCLDEGVNPNQTDYITHLVPINYAASSGHLEMAELLLSRGAKVSNTVYSDKEGLNILFFSNSRKRVLIS